MAVLLPCNSGNTAYLCLPSLSQVVLVLVIAVQTLTIESASFHVDASERTHIFIITFISALFLLAVLQFLCKLKKDNILKSYNKQDHYQNVRLVTALAYNKDVCRSFKNKITAYHAILSV
jgi:hypothetical protein